jgi:hypothetical protein
LLHRLYPNIEVANLHREPPARVGAVAAKLAAAGAADSPSVVNATLALFESAKVLIRAPVDEIERIELFLRLLKDVERSASLPDRLQRKQRLGPRLNRGLAEAKRFTDLTLYEGSAFRPEDLALLWQI